MNRMIGQLIHVFVIRSRFPKGDRLFYGFKKFIKSELLGP